MFAARSNPEYSPFMKSLQSRVIVQLVVALGLILFVASFRLIADQIEMQSGDRYVGRVVALTNDTLVIQSELLGTVRLPRNKVASINLGPGATTNIARVPGRTNHLSLATTSATNASRNAVGMRVPNSPSPQGEGEKS